MNPLSNYGRDLELALHQSKVEGDLHALEQQMQDLGRSSTPRANTDISLRFLAMDYFVLDQYESIESSFGRLMRRLCGREVPLEACTGVSASGHRQSLGIWASILDVALDLAGRTDTFSSPARPASPEDVFVTPPSSPQHRSDSALSSPLRRPTQTLRQVVPVSKVQPSPVGLRDPILRRDGLFYERTAVASEIGQDNLYLDCSIWPHVSSCLWATFASSMSSIAAHLHPDLLPILATTWFTAARSAQAPTVHALVSMANRFHSLAPAQVDESSDRNRPSELCRALVRASPAAIQIAADEPKQRIMWGALLAHGLGPLSTAKAEAYVDCVLRLTQEDVARVSAVAALALSATEQLPPRRYPLVVMRHIETLAVHVSHDGRTAVGVRELAHVATSLLSVPEDDVGSMCMCLNKLWPKLEGPAQVWAQARLIGPLTAVDPDLRAQVTRLLVSEQACPTLPRHLDLIVDWLHEILTEVQSEPGLLEQTIKLMQRSQTSISMERLCYTLTALKSVPRPLRRGLCRVLLTLVGDQGGKDRNLRLHTFIETLRDFSPVDWQLLRDERGAFNVHAGSEGIDALACPHMVKDFVEQTRANGDHAVTPITANHQHQVAIPRESTEVGLRREQLQQDMQKLAEAVPAELRPQPSAALRSWIRYLENSSVVASQEPAKRANALWAIRTIEKRSTIPSTSVLSIPDLCSILLYVTENHRIDEGEEGGKSRKNMRHSFVERLADCVETKDRDRQLICSNGQGQQLISVLHGYGFSLPSEANLTRRYPKELICHLTQEFAARLQRLHMEEPSTEQIKQFCLDARKKADEAFGPQTEDWHTFIKDLASFLAVEKWGKLPWAAPSISSQY